MEPVVPFEPISSEIIPIGSEWISQIKWDGVRILTYYDGQKIKLFNRKLHERTQHYPELTNIKAFTSAKSIILDGEVIALNTENKPSFHEVMRRDGVRNLEQIKHNINEIPIYYMIFDILHLNGKQVYSYLLKDRIDLLSNIITPNEQIQLVPIEKDGHQLFNVAKEHDLEGIVCKNLNSKYTIHGKNNNWRKIKNYKDIIAVIGGVTYRSEVVNSIVVGLYDRSQRLIHIGNVGTGRLSSSDWQELTLAIEPLKMKQSPFINEPETANKVQWLQPVITVKIQYIEWPKGGSLRQPSIQAFLDYNPADCILED